MQLTINIPNEQLFDKIVWLLNSFKNQGLEIIDNKLKARDELDFSAFKVDSLNEIDGLKYQKKIRDEW